MDTNGGDIGCLLVIVIAMFVLIEAFDDSNEPPKPDAPEQKVESLEEDPNFIEGVVTRLIPGQGDITTVVFENGDEYDLNLGDHQIHVGEWNQLRVDDGYVHESYLGEGTFQEIARQ